MKEHPVYIRAQIGKYMTVCLVDAASQKCVLPGRLIDTMSLEPADCRLFAANGMTINVIGEKTLDVHVGDLTIPTRFVISRNVTDPMLGVNWLRRNRVIWDFAKDLLLVNGRKFELISRLGKNMCRRVVAMEDTVIPARSQAIVPGRVEMNRMKVGIKGHVWTTKANELRGGISVARTVVPERFDNVPVLVLNSSNVEKKVGARTILANLAMAEFVEEGMESGDIKNGGSCEHLHGLMTRIDGSVTREQAEGLTCLLKRYSDLFSKNELDLGETSLAKHRIDTGDARPIRQTLRKQPFHLLDKIDEHVKEMIRAGVVEPSNSSLVVTRLTLCWL